MNDNVIQPNDSKEKKTNRNLAIGIGVLGLGSFALFYVLMFAVMILRPGLMFKLMPIPAITDAAISDGNRTYLVQQKVDLSKIDPQEKKQQPEIKHFLSVLNGTEPGASQEIPAYAQAFGAHDRLVFLNKGSYRMYDGKLWVDEKSEAIGNDPRGLLTSAGMYVLSEHASGPHLSLIKSNTAIDIPLPADYLAGNKKNNCPCAKFAWYQGRLALFWSDNEAVSWTVLNKDTWMPTAVTSFSGGYEVISDDNALYFFHREGDGLDRQLSYYVYANDAWSGPVRLPVPGGFMNWDVFLQQGKLRLFTQQFTTQTLYTIVKGSLVDPIQLQGPFKPSSMIGTMAFVVAITNALTVLVVFGVSAGIRRFKKRIWNENGAQYEFASLFRRFLATMIDNMVLLVPLAIVVALLMPNAKDIARNPFLFLFMILAVLVLFFIGGFLYHSLLEGLYGRTLGKRICRIRVLKADFSPCGLSAGFLRNLLRIVDAFFYYLVATVLLAGTVKWQRIGDVAAETVVVKEKR